MLLTRREVINVAGHHEFCQEGLQQDKACCRCELFSMFDGCGSRRRILRKSLHGSPALLSPAQRTRGFAILLQTILR